VRALIAAETASLKAAATASENKLAILETKLVESDLVIAKQARELLAAKAAAATAKPKAYCKYGNDGKGEGNVWPLRALTDPLLTRPHNFDTSENATYKLLVGRWKSFKYEWRTLACAGSYLHDFRREYTPLLKLLIDVGDTAEEKADNIAWAEELENTLEGVYDQLATRFALITELVQPDADEARLDELERKLYPREGVRVPASSLDAWNKAFDERTQVSLDKKLANNEVGGCPRGQAGRAARRAPRTERHSGAQDRGQGQGQGQVRRAEGAWRGRVLVRLSDGGRRGRRS
jgi:hypothetical protein